MPTVTRPVHIDNPELHYDASADAHAARQCDEHPEVAYHRRTGRLICKTCDTRGTVVNPLTSESVICHRCGGAGDHEPEPDDDPAIDRNAEYFLAREQQEATDRELAATLKASIEFERGRRRITSTGVSMTSGKRRYAAVVYYDRGKPRIVGRFADENAAMTAAQNAARAESRKAAVS